MLWAESSEGTRRKEKTSPPMKCHHFDIGSLLTFLHCCMRDSHFKCQQAHGSRGGSWQRGGDCGRADLIKRQAPLSPRHPPRHLSSTERGNKSDRVQSLSLICQWGEWVGMGLSDRPAVACLPPCQPYWIMTWQEVACYEPRRGRGEIPRGGDSVRGGGGGNVAEMKPGWM